MESNQQVNHQPSPTRKAVRKTAITLGGGATVLVGLALIPLPGPGTIVVLGGLTVLGKEFPAAKKAVSRVKGTALKAYEAVRSRKKTQS